MRLESFPADNFIPRIPVRWPVSNFRYGPMSFAATDRSRRISGRASFAAPFRGHSTHRYLPIHSVGSDDHLRNFRLLHGEDGWRLAPAFDLLPDVGRLREHSMDFLYGRECRHFPKSPVHLQTFFSRPRSSS